MSNIGTYGKTHGAFRWETPEGFNFGRDVVPSEDLKAEIQAHCKALTTPYRYPRQIEFTRELPKTASGKIRRVELRG